MVAKFLTIESIARPITTTTKVRGLVKTQRAVSKVSFQAVWQEFPTPAATRRGGSTILSVTHKQTSA